MTPTSEIAQGYWKDLLLSFGLGESYLTGKHTACPICNEGNDRFRFDDKEGRGTFFCNHCGAGDGFKMLELINGWSFAESAKRIDEALHNVELPKYKPKKNDRESKKVKLNGLAKRFTPLSDDDVVFKYLNARGVDNKVISQLSADIGLIEQLEYWDGGKCINKFDSMACMVRNNGKPVTYHVTYLDGLDHAQVDNPRKLMPPVETIKGGAVRLFDHDSTLGIAEGVETALAASQVFKVPTWAAINANNLKSFEIPEGIKEIHIFGDNDKSYMRCIALSRKITFFAYLRSWF